MTDAKDAHKIRRSFRDMFTAIAARTKTIFDGDGLIASHRYYAPQRYNVRYRNYTVAGVTEFQMVARKVTDDKYKLHIERMQITNSDNVREKLLPSCSEMKGTFTLSQVFAHMQKFEVDTEKKHNLTDKQPRQACYFRKHAHFTHNQF